MTQVSTMLDELQAAAEAEGEHPPLDTRISTEGVAGLDAQYIAPSEEGAWIPGWRLFVNRWGEEFGVPIPIPRGQAARMIQQKRPDGGKLFTVIKPAVVRGQGQFQCFIGDCQKRVHERIQLVAHIEAYHRNEAQTYAPLLARLRDAALQDNPRLLALVEDMAKLPEDAREVAVDLPGLPAAATWENVAVDGIFDCGDCDWKPKPDTKRPATALRMHRRKRHGGET